MAKVTAEDRKKTKKRTGDKSYPMQTAAQIRSAIKLRHHGKSKSASRVLSLASSAISRLLRAGKISASTAKSLRSAVAAARKKDSGKGKTRKLKGNAFIDLVSKIAGYFNNQDERVDGIVSENWSVGG